MQINWILKPYNDLTLDELYQLLQLRNEVFIVEQNCPFNDLDGKDRYCHHLMGFTGPDPSLVAYTRLVPAGVSYAYPSIGRVVTAPHVRRHRQGRELMQRSIEELVRLYGEGPIQIGAQLYLKSFYESFGFAQLGPAYLEDGIEHIEMVRKNEEGVANTGHFFSS
jgi:ElaA protein